MNALQGKIAVVTGGNSGIGLATARRFVEEGAHVFLTARRQAQLDQAAAQLGRNVTAVPGDITKMEDLDRLAATVRAEKGHLDIIVSNAGITEQGNIDSLTPAHFDKVFN
ncbi:MAG: SDR family oxidoreductase, partial [Gluconacetobacter diazotrophicus]|nr:SDR family oxidoreductase [Gluconacetobacter diazotrophicus]